MATYKLKLDSNMTTQWYKDKTPRVAVGDEGTTLVVTLANGFSTINVKQYDKIEFRATSPDKVSVIQTESIDFDENDESTFICKLPSGIAKGSGEITDARFRLFKNKGKENEEIESTSLFMMRIISTPGMVEVNGDFIDRLDELITQALASRDAIDLLEKDADGQLKSFLKKASKDLTDQTDAIKTAKDNFIEEKNELIKKFGTDTDEKITAKFKELDTSFGNKVTAWSKNVTDKISEWQTKIDGLNVDQISADITALNGRLTIIKNDISGIDLPAMKTAVDEVKKDMDKKADKSDTYTKSQVDTKLESAGKVKTVNNKQPDGNGNITVDIPKVDLSGYAKTADVDDKISKIPKPDLSTYATKEEVSTAERNAKNTAKALVDALQKSKGITKSEYDALNPGEDGVLYFVTED